MKKIILSLIIVGFLIFPFSVSAVTQEEIIQNLIDLLLQTIAKLQQQINDLLVQQAKSEIIIQELVDKVNPPPPPEPVIKGCMDKDAYNYNPKANVHTYTCDYNPIKGCMDEEALNYNEYATINIGNCQFSSEVQKRREEEKKEMERIKQCPMCARG